MSCSHSSIKGDDGRASWVDAVTREKELRQVRRAENGRLVYYIPAGSSNGFWERHWQKHRELETYDWALRGELGWIEEFVTRYLPKHQPIIEAGCGLGGYVLALRTRGYDAEGVEWGGETVEAVRARYPELPVRQGDVTRLDVPDGYYGGYLSLGVMEHRREGPMAFLRETHRVLVPGGMAIISVPYFHALRRLKGKLGLYERDESDMDFYQYAFTRKEFAGLVREAGFEVIDSSAYGALKSLKDEIPALRRLLGWGNIGSRLANRIDRSHVLGKRLGHMLLVACEKRSGSSEERLGSS